MRDGLDVLASQMTNGAFNPDPVKLGKSWLQNYRNFYNYMKANPQHKCVVVKYEDLVVKPEATMKRLCVDIDKTFDAQMINQHQAESTLADNPRGQLSVERVRQPIDASAIGRWREILSEADVAAFLEGCGGREIYENRGYKV